MSAGTNGTLNPTVPPADMSAGTNGTLNATVPAVEHLVHFPWTESRRETWGPKLRVCKRHSRAQYIQINNIILASHMIILSSGKT
jgi:hypothetical protein